MLVTNVSQSGYSIVSISKITISISEEVFVFLQNFVKLTFYLFYAVKVSGIYFNIFGAL